MNLLLNIIEHKEYTPEKLEERRKQKQEMIDRAYKRKAKEVYREAEMQHIPGTPVKMGGPGSRIEDWEISFFDKARIDREFPELINESEWYREGIYKDDVFNQDLDFYLYGDPDRFVFSEEEWNNIKDLIPKDGIFYQKDGIKIAKQRYREKMGELTKEYVIGGCFNQPDDKLPELTEEEIKEGSKIVSEMINNVEKKNNSSEKSTYSKNWSYTIKEGEHAGITLWSGRYCAVTGIIYCKVDFKHNNQCDIYVLAEKRGNGTPDFQGMWCLPCGFLECSESGQEGIARETLEETGIEIIPKQFKLIGVQTDPEKSNKGHVTLRYAVEVDTMETPNYQEINGEKDEVADVRWINLNSIDTYKWAFGHDELLKNYFSKQEYSIRNFDKRFKYDVYINDNELI